MCTASWHISPHTAPTCSPAPLQRSAALNGVLRPSGAQPLDAAAFDQPAPSLPFTQNCATVLAPTCGRRPTLPRPAICTRLWPDLPSAPVLHSTCNPAACDFLQGGRGSSRSKAALSPMQPTHAAFSYRRGLLGISGGLMCPGPTRKSHHQGGGNLTILAHAHNARAVGRCMELYVFLKGWSGEDTGPPKLGSSLGSAGFRKPILGNSARTSRTRGQTQHHVSQIRALCRNKHKQSMGGPIGASWRGHVAHIRHTRTDLAGLSPAVRHEFTSNKAADARCPYTSWQRVERGVGWFEGVSMVRFPV